jgi:hypothetical protein
VRVLGVDAAINEGDTHACAGCWVGVKNPGHNSLPPRLRARFSLSACGGHNLTRGESIVECPADMCAGD